MDLDKSGIPALLTLEVIFWHKHLNYLSIYYFVIHHYGTPVNLKAVEVYNSTGQLVWDKRYNGNATTEITVDIAKYAGGVYMLKLFYTNKTIQQKIVKQ